MNHETEQRLKTLFPRASRSFFNANSGLRAIERKPNGVSTLVSKAQGKTKSDARVIVGIVLLRVRILDKENAYTATKSLTDCLCEVGLIPGDAEDEIELTVTQEKVKHRYEQKTVVNITYP